MRVGRSTPLEKRSSAVERSEMEAATEREEGGQKENSWEEEAELMRGDTVDSFAIVGYSARREGERERREEK